MLVVYEIIKRVFTGFIKGVIVVKEKLPLFSFIEDLPKYLITMSIFNYCSTCPMQLLN